MIHDELYDLSCSYDIYYICDIIIYARGLELAIGWAGPGQHWAGPKPGRAKIGPDFSGQNFSSPTRPKNRAGRAK